MNGTALFEGVTVLFLAQVFGVHLGLGAQLIRAAEERARAFHDVPRTPAGPSLQRMTGTPGTLTVCQLSAPASSETLCSSVSDASVASTLLVTAGSAC